MFKLFYPFKAMLDSDNHKSKLHVRLSKHLSHIVSVQKCREVARESK